MQFSFDTRPSDSPLVRGVWRTASDSGGVFNSLAETHWGLAITRQQGKTTVTLLGPQTSARLAPVPQEAEILGLVFKLGVSMPGLDALALVDKTIELPNDGRRFWLDSKSWEIPTFENADDFVAALVAGGRLVYEPVIEKALTVDAPKGMSPRTMQRQFLRTTGMSRNTVRQIERARSALAMLNDGEQAMDVIEKAGYYDQSHLIRSFGQYLGYRPTQSQDAADWRALLTSTW